MAAFKRLNTNYTIDTPDVFMTGNLHIAGTHDTTTVTNTNIQDKDITLNVGEPGWGVGGNASPGTASLQVDRGLQANVGIRWNETSDVWELTTDGASFSTILTSGGGGLSNVVEDTTPQLGGNLETNGFHLQIDETTDIPTATADKSKIYADAVGSAGSGLFVVNSNTASDELVTKSKAIVFSIIL